MRRLTFAIIALTASLCGPLAQAPLAQAGDSGWLTITSLIGKSKYADGFKHFDHVNPDAPKGGTLNSVVRGTFDSFNPFIVRGAPAAGLNYQGGLLYDNLMAKSTDEPSASYPLIAEAYKYPDDYSTATYRINPAAKWHDGTAITVEDVVWSFKVLIEHSPQWTQYFGNVKEARIDSEHEVTFIFDQKNNRELPLIMGDLPVLPKHWWQGTNAKGEKRDISKSTLEPPLGSGPYKIESFKSGEEIVWKRVENSWAKDMPTRLGRYNFDRMRFVYFKDENAMWQAFTKGGFEDYRAENRSQKWAIGYDFKAAKAGDVVKEEFVKNTRFVAQDIAINTRRDKFKDRRVREALTWAFDFETLNKNLFYGLYRRNFSYFQGDELVARGVPEGLELEILEPYRGKVPDEVFNREFKPPVFANRRATRTNIGKAFALFKQAGWENRGGKMTNIKTGERFKIEYLARDPSSERIINPYIENLRRLGIDARLRIVDTAQYIARMGEFDYDMATLVRQSQSQSPGNEQREYWNSSAADRSGSRNYPGIKNPVIDALVEKIVFAKDRAELAATTRALDRVLLWNYYYIPNWHNPKIWIAYWDKFGIPRPQPKLVGVDVYSWWIDAEKEAALAKKYKGR
jgi:microcin C transport system substrate-binding protein